MQDSLGGTHRHAGFAACRRRMNVLATGIIAAGSGSLTRRGGEGRTREPPINVAKGRHKEVQPDARDRVPTSFRSASLADAPCRDTGSRAMNLPGARYRGYRVGERLAGGRKGRNASDMRGISVSCAVFRAVRSGFLRPRITRDNCRYRA